MVENQKKLSKLEIIIKEHIHNLHIGEDGSLCGQTESTWYPSVNYLKNIRILNGKISYEIVKTVEDAGKVI